ncbi:unnamed protein product [Cylindrotheca closterium]|uniref:Uncharacterized protein n=1 Tax=Cylindrotheca closterium TaxID=2856 RepID=A0AAD2FRX9_9STRA|nr:unnamed protein product [Cylindrotheca closterium]
MTEEGNSAHYIKGINLIEKLVQAFQSIESSQEDFSVSINLLDDQEILSSLCGMSLCDFQMTHLSVEDVLFFQTYHHGFEIVASNEELDHTNDHSIELDDCDSSLGNQWKIQQLPLDSKRTIHHMTGILHRKLAPFWAPKFEEKWTKSLVGKKSFWQKGVLHGVYNPQASRFDRINLSTINWRVGYIWRTLDSNAETAPGGGPSIDEIGKLWLNECEPIPQPHAERKWLEHRSSLVYAIDEKARVVIPDMYHKYNMRNLPPELQFLHDSVKLAKPLLEMLNFDNVTCGSLLHGQCFSIPFLVWTYFKGIDEGKYMVDPTRSGNAPDRLLRVSSVDALEDLDHDKCDEVFVVFGTQPPQLIRAHPCTEWEKAILQCMNSEEQCRSKFIGDYYTNRRGGVYAEKNTPVPKVYNLLVLAVGNDGFGWHSDERDMLFSEDASLPANSSFKKRHLRVPTAFFQNSDQGNCALSFRQGSGASSMHRVKNVLLGPAGIHWQGDYNQVKLRHKAATRMQCKGGARFYRLTVSCRESPGKLQKEGMNRLLSCFPNLQKFDHKWQYTIRINFLKSASPLSSTAREGLAAHFPGLLADDDSSNNAYKQVLPTTVVAGIDELNHRKKHQSALLHKISDLNKANYGTRAHAGPLPPEYPLQKKPTLAMDKTPLAMKISSGPVLSKFEADGYRVGVQVKDNSRVFWQGTRFGNGMQPKAGDFVDRQDVGSMFGLTDNGRIVEPFGSNPMTLNCIHLSKPLRASLLSSNLRERRGPYQDFLSAENRKGFDVYLRGGALSSPGASGPVVDAPVVVANGSAGVSHIMPTIQSIGEKHNAALLTACLLDKVVHVFVTDHQLPESERVGECADGGQYTQSGYCGCYRLQSAATVPPMSLTEMQSYLNAVKEKYGSEISHSELTIANLSFRSQKCFCITLVPINQASVPHKNDFKIKMEDKRCICFPIPHHSKPDEFCIGADKEIGTVLDDPLNNSELIMTQPSRRTINPQNMPLILSGMLLATAFRATRLNVDTNGKVGPLVDQYEDSQFEIPMYKRSFVNASENTAYLSTIGPIFQNHPFPSPLRCVDAKVAMLLEEYPSTERLSRNMNWIRQPIKDDPLRLVRHCMLTEVIGNARTLHLWRSSYSDEEQGENVETDHYQWIFPSTEPELESFLELITIAGQQGEVDGKRIMKRFLHGQYCQKHFIKQPSDLITVVRAIWSISKVLLDQLCTNCDLTFESCVKFLMESFDRYHQLPSSKHQVASMLSNIDMLLAGEPFGSAVTSFRGKGSKYGADLLDSVALVQWLNRRKVQTNGTKSEEQLILLWLSVRVKLFGDFMDWLHVDSRTGALMVTYSGMKANVFDAEHILCKFYIYMEYSGGGARAFSNKPMWRKDNCHPILGVEFKNLSSYMVNNVVKQFASRMDMEGLQVRRRVSGLLSNSNSELLEEMKDICQRALETGATRETFTRNSDPVDRGLNAHIHNVGYMVSHQAYNKLAGEVDCNGATDLRLATLAERKHGRLLPSLEDCVDLHATLTERRFELPGGTFHSPAYDTEDISCSTMFGWHLDKGGVSDVVRFVPVEGHFYLFIEESQKLGYQRIG